MKKKNNNNDGSEGQQYLGKVYFFFNSLRKAPKTTWYNIGLGIFFTSNFQLYRWLQAKENARETSATYILADIYYTPSSLVLIRFHISFNYSICCRYVFARGNHAEK